MPRFGAPAIFMNSVYEDSDIPSISTQWPVTIQTRTKQAEQHKDMISALVNRPQQPKEILYRNKGRHTSVSFQDARPPW